VTGPAFPPPVATDESWLALRPGTRLSVVKLAPNGAEAARYPGEVAVGFDRDGWIVVHATWTYRAMDLDGLEFRTGDHLFEWFSPRQPLNAFAVLSDSGQFKGWYANVTYPARLDPSMDPPLLSWHDLFVDLVGLPDKSYTIRDDDELETSGLRQLNPQRHTQIQEARSELIHRFERELPPFAGLDEATRVWASRRDALSPE
jgi:Protein of unknown function (DUF402)